MLPTVLIYRLSVNVHAIKAAVASKLSVPPLSHPHAHCAMRNAKRSEAMPFPNGIAAAVVVVVVGAINKVPTPTTRNVVSITCSALRHAQRSEANQSNVQNNKKKKKKKKKR